MYETAIFVLEHEIKRIDRDLEYHKKQIVFLEKRIKIEEIPQYIKTAKSEMANRINEIEDLKVFKINVVNEVELLKTNATLTE